MGNNNSHCCCKLGGGIYDTEKEVVVQKESTVKEKQIIPRNEISITDKISIALNSIDILNSSFVFIIYDPKKSKTPLTDALKNLNQDKFWLCPIDDDGSVFVNIFRASIQFKKFYDINYTLISKPTFLILDALRCAKISSGHNVFVPRHYQLSKFFANDIKVLMVTSSGKPENYSLLRVTGTIAHLEGGLIAPDEQFAKQFALDRKL